MASPREQAIRERAYAIWEQEGHPHGKDIDHWLRAEAEINFLRINELRGLVKNPTSPDVFFQNFKQTIREWPIKKTIFLALERELQGLAPCAWEYLKTDVSPLLQKKHPTCGWQSLFDKLNHARAYNHLARIGCTDIKFVPEAKQ